MLHCCLFSEKYFHVIIGDLRQPLWSSGQSSWLQIQRSRLDPQRYQIFWEIVSLQRGPLSLVSTVEELLGRESSGSGLDSREKDCRNPLRWPSETLYPQTLALTSPTSGGRSVCIFRSRTKAIIDRSPMLAKKRIDYPSWKHEWNEGIFFGKETAQCIICFCILLFLNLKNKNKLRGLSPRANYTDRATATCRWS
jgi:hypothetical protein